MKAQDIVDGLMLLKPYAGNAYFVSAEHDVLHTDVETTSVPLSVAKQLIRLGWHKEEYGCWAAFT